MVKGRLWNRGSDTGIYQESRGSSTLAHDMNEALINEGGRGRGLGPAAEAGIDADRTEDAGKTVRRNVAVPALRGGILICA